MKVYTRFTIVNSNTTTVRVPTYSIDGSGPINMNDNILNVSEHSVPSLFRVYRRVALILNNTIGFFMYLCSVYFILLVPCEYIHGQHAY